MGYNLHFDYWHKGYCTEAMKAIIDYVHKELGVNRICSCHAVDNPRSGKVMENADLNLTTMTKSQNLIIVPLLKQRRM